MNKPSKYQKAIYEFLATGSGNAIVQAVAGSGKTTTILNCAKLIPENSMSIFVAFNKSIATELNDKLPKNVQARTLHSLGYSMFFANTNSKVKLDNDKLENIIKLVLKENQIEEYDTMYSVMFRQIKIIVPLLKAFNSNYKDFKEVEDVIVYKNIECNLDSIFHLIGEVMDKCKKQISTIDFDDMVWIPVVNNFTTKTYDFVFVDEVQDLNKIQFELIKKLCNGNTRIIAVGDRQQSIYAFRGADTNSMDNFKEYFKAVEMPLSISYRCSKNVVELAKTIVPEIEVFDKAIDGEVDAISFDNIISKAEDEDMVLCRTNAPLIKVVFAFIRNNKKAIIRGTDIAKKIVKRVNQYKVSSLEELHIKILRYKELQSEKLLLIEKGEYDKRKKNHLLTEIDICDTILVVSENVGNIDELKSKVLEIFSDDREGIVCSSVHKAKGLEADNVFILNYNLMPHPMAETEDELQQEMNIKYVAITRAKKNLFYCIDELR